MLIVLALKNSTWHFAASFPIFVVYREWVNLAVVSCCLALGSMNILTVLTAIYFYFDPDKFTI